MGSAQPKAGQVVAGKYRIDGILGEGGMGVVYSATHLVTGKPIAIKWLPDGANSKLRRHRLLLEAQNAGRIHHPNVVDIYDFGEEGDAVFLVMERLNGVPLTAALVTAPMTARDAVRLLMPVFRGIAAAHAQGIIHRDLKPDNIFLCEDSEGRATTVKVLDFGISKVLNDANLSLTQTGMVLGTPLYMSPEQLRGKKDLDGRCDQYALACMLYEMLEGEPPFDGESYADLSVAKLERKPRPFARQLPSQLEQAVMRGMARNREKRFETVEAFAAALEPFADGARFADTETDWSGVFPARRAEALTTPVLGADTDADTSADADTIAEGGWSIGKSLLIIAGVLALLFVPFSIRVWLEARASEPISEPLPSRSGATETVTATGGNDESAETALEEANLEEAALEEAALEEAALEEAALEEAALEEAAPEEAAPEEAAPEETEAPRPRMRVRRPTMRHRTGNLTLEDF